MKLDNADLKIGAEEIKKLFDSFMDVGFTEHQALYIVGKAIEATIVSKNGFQN